MKIFSVINALYNEINSMIKYITIFILLLATSKLYAAPQQDSTTTEIQHNILEELKQPGTNGGNVKLSTSPSIDNLLKLHIKQCKKSKTFSGYRIQIHSTSSYGSNMAHLKQMRDNFEKTFPDIPAYLNYFDPDFKIRVGNFHSKLECIPTLHRIKKQYPSSYPVKTTITLDELKRKPLQDIPVEEILLED